MLDNIEKALEFLQRECQLFENSSSRQVEKVATDAIDELKKYRERLESRYLTQEEVNELPVGTKIIVHWSGGNNNCQYEIAGHKDGLAHINNIYNDPLDFVGIDPPKTMVRKAAVNIIKGE